MTPVPDWNTPPARHSHAPARSARLARRPHGQRPSTGEQTPCGGTGNRSLGTTDPLRTTNQAGDPDANDDDAEESEPDRQALVFATELDPADRELLTRFRGYCLRYNGPHPVWTVFHPPRPRRRGRFTTSYTARALGLGAAAACIRALCVVTDLSTRTSGPGWWLGLAPLFLTLAALWQLALAAICAVDHLTLAGRTEDRATARVAELHRQYIDPELDLNAAGRTLLARARAAADQAAACGFGPNTAVGVSLAERVWRLARQLADTNTWEHELGRAEQALAEAGEEIDPDTAARRRALDSSYPAFTERVGQIEAHARGRENQHLRRRARETVARLDPDMLVKLAADRAVRDADEKRELADLEADLYQPQPVGEKD